MEVTHIVLFQFKPDMSSDDCREFCARMFRLKDDCKKKNSDAPYIVSVTGGKVNSREGLQGGHTHAFVLEFGNVEDRDYYVDEDPVHLQFKRDAGKFVAKVQVLAFTNGLY